MFKFFKKSKKEEYKCKNCGRDLKEGDGCGCGSQEKTCGCGSGKYAKECCGA
ncbi:hypothetical protein MYX06_02985 [Patescibacteria group bacterium AH-259-L05]|nr:hypothetical protein [Patescibacteria group bacterium AH-259-L05]